MLEKERTFNGEILLKCKVSHRKFAVGQVYKRKFIHIVKYVTAFMQKTKQPKHWRQEDCWLRYQINFRNSAFNARLRE